MEDVTQAADELRSALNGAMPTDEELAQEERRKQEREKIDREWLEVGLPEAIAEADEAVAFWSSRLAHCKRQRKKWQDEFNKLPPGWSTEHWRISKHSLEWDLSMQDANLRFDNAAYERESLER